MIPVERPVGFAKSDLILSRSWQRAANPNYRNCLLIQPCDRHWSLAASCHVCSIHGCPCGTTVQPPWIYNEFSQLCNNDALRPQLWTTRLLKLQTDMHLSKVVIDWTKVDQPEIVAQRFASRRSVVYGTKGIVSSSQPLATEAGLEILRKGGNAGVTFDCDI